MWFIDRPKTAGGPGGGADPMHAILMVSIVLLLTQALSSRLVLERVAPGDYKRNSMLARILFAEMVMIDPRGVERNTVVLEEEVTVSGATASDSFRGGGQDGGSEVGETGGTTGA